MIIEALAKLEAVRGFRLKDLMKSLGMDHTQPVLFYRTIIKEAREWQQRTMPDKR